MCISRLNNIFKFGLFTGKRIKIRIRFGVSSINCFQLFLCIDDFA